MKTFTIIALIAAALLLFGGIAAAKYRGVCSGPDGRAAWIAERIGSRLSLGETQQQQLDELLETLAGLRRDLQLSREQGRDGILRLIAEPQLDREQALTMLEQRLDLLSRRAPELIEAVADFTDSLDPTQREQLQEWIARRGHGPFGRW